LPATKHRGCEDSNRPFLGCGTRVQKAPASVAHGGVLVLALAHLHALLIKAWSIQPSSRSIHSSTSIIGRGGCAASSASARANFGTMRGDLGQTRPHASTKYPGSGAGIAADTGNAARRRRDRDFSTSSRTKRSPTLMVGLRREACWTRLQTSGRLLAADPEGHGCVGCRAGSQAERPSRRNISK